MKKELKRAEISEIKYNFLTNLLNLIYSREKLYLIGNNIIYLVCGYYRICGYWLDIL